MTTQTTVDDVLKALEALVGEIAPLRTQANVLRGEVAQARKDYEHALRELNEEAERLNAQKATLAARLRAGASASVAPTATPARAEGSSVATSAPQATPSVAPTNPTPLPTDTRAERKRALADFIISVVDSAQENVVRERLNVVLADASRDIGDMLEDLSWGPIWSARSEWETIDEQAARLEGWRVSLAARRVHWQRELADLEREGQRYFLPEKRKRDPGAWLEFLGDLADEQRHENARIKHEVEVLDRQWSARRAAGDLRDA